MPLTPQQRYEQAMARLDDDFADGRLNDEWVSTIEVAVAEERERCLRIVQHGCVIDPWVYGAIRRGDPA